MKINRRRGFIILLAQAALDAAAVYYAFILAYTFRFTYDIFPVTKGVPQIGQYTRVMPLVTLVFLTVFNWSGLYDTHRVIHKTDEFIAVLKSVFVSAVFVTAGTFLYREYSYSRLVLLYAFLLSGAFVYGSHRLVRFFRERFLSGGAPSILLVGGAKSREKLVRNISKSGGYTIHHLPSVDMKSIGDTARADNIGEIVLMDSDAERGEVIELINFCEQSDIEFKMVPDMVELKMGEMSFDSYFGLPVLNLKHPLFEPVNYYTKRTMDIIASMALLTLAAPFLILTGFLVKIDSRGPILYTHMRKGLKGKDFRFYKFRSMVNDADDKLKGLMKYNERSGAAFKMKRDPRVTRVGRVIRKYSIDEIPQLFNVLKGDMSLVGHRPQVLWEASFYDSEAKRRLSILPGVTGLWQVSGRSDLTYEDMIRLDLYYLENWTAGMDAKILLKTITAVVMKKGAC